jgi:membrane associated rhomboid family serine protease
VVVYLVELVQGPALNKFIFLYGLVPARFTVPRVAAYFSISEQVFSLVSFMFLHGGFWHLLGNMWFLYIFGDNVEDRLGPFRYLIFYFLCGIVSGLSHLLVNPLSNVPTIGASGAIAGVMGAYFILHPKARILTLIPIIIIPYFIEIPAFIFLGIWFILQFYSATLSQGSITGIAWWAHIGGFVFGMILLKGFLALPAAGVTDKVRRKTSKKKTHRLQVIRPTGSLEDANLYGIITISPHEADWGSQKLVNIPWGFHRRLYNVKIPPGMEAGKILRLKGMGKQISDGQKGDLLLKVVVQS